MHLHGDREGTVGQEIRISIMSIQDPMVEDFLKRRSTVVGSSLRSASLELPGVSGLADSGAPDLYSAKLKSEVQDTRLTRSRLSQGGGIPADDLMNRKPKTIADIVADDAVPNRYFLDARIIDWLPVRERDVAVPRCHLCKTLCRAAEQPSCENCPSNENFRYEFSFSVLLQDASGQLPASVSGEDAVGAMLRRSA